MVRLQLAALQLAAHAFAQQLKPPPHAPMALGLLIQLFYDAEAKTKLMRDLGMSTCFLSLEAYLGKFTPQLAAQFHGLLSRYQVSATTVEAVGPQPLKWSFLESPATIGLVPPQYREARMATARS